MQRWIPQDQKMILQSIADDERRPAHEREAAQRELATPVSQSTPPSQHRRGRNANVPQTQADEDSDLEKALTFRQNDGLTIMDRIEVERGYDPATKNILDAIGNNCLLWLFTNNLADIPVLIACVNRTGSSLVKTKALDALRLISTRSPIDSARDQAREFLNQLDTQ
jgi:hypothetical protein